MIFVDTGAWYASVIVDDENHHAARKWLEANVSTLCTTDYILDETLTLLKARGHSAIALEIGEMFFRGELAELVAVSESDMRQAWQIFRQFRDKDRSFTDCTSKAVMERLNIARSFSFDHHFRQFGSMIVVP